jgi:hypothetical protein
MYAPAYADPSPGRTTNKGWVQHFPFVPSIAAIVYLVGIIVWANGFTGAWNATQQGLDAMGVIRIAVLDAIRTACIAVVAVLTVFMAIGLVNSFWRMSIGRLYAKSGVTSSTAGPYLIVNGIFTTMAWLATLIFVAILGGFLIWGFSAVVLEKTAMQVTLAGDQIAELRSNTTGTIKKATSAVPGLGEVASKAVNAAIDSASVLLGLGPNITDPTPKGASGQLKCPFVCIDLSEYDWMQKNRSCICTTERLQAVSQRANEAYTRLVPAVVGMFLMFAAASWMTHALVSHFTRTSAESDCADMLEEGTMQQRQSQQQGQYPQMGPKFGPLPA